MQLMNVEISNELLIIVCFSHCSNLLNFVVGFNKNNMFCNVIIIILLLLFIMHKAAYRYIKCSVS